jgi:hypothetical protein
MSAPAVSKQTPARARALFAVAVPFGSWEPLARVPDLGTFKQSVTGWISDVERLAKHAGRFSDDFPVELVEGDLRLSEGDEETWRATLDTMRISLSLLTGAASRAKARDIARLLPGLAPRYLKAHAALVESARHMVAFVAFMLGEADEREIQDSLLPAPPPAGNAGPSVSLGLG